LKLHRRFLFAAHMFCLTLHNSKSVLIAPNLTKKSIVQRLQRQSSFVLPGKKTNSNQLTLQRPIHRGRAK